MAHHDVFGDSVVYDFFRQTINAIIEVANADGDATELAAIVTRLETLRGDLVTDEGTGHKMPADTFPGEGH